MLSSVGSLKTLKEWNELGFLVNKGAKSIGKNTKGVPIFNQTQVRYSTYRRSAHYKPWFWNDYEDDWENDHHAGPYY